MWLPSRQAPPGDVSGFPNERRAGASHSPDPVRCSRTWEGDHPAFPCLLRSLRPPCPTFSSLNPVPWQGFIRIFFPLLLFIVSLCSVSLFLKCCPLPGARLPAALHSSHSSKQRYLKGDPPVDYPPLSPTVCSLSSLRLISNLWVVFWCH